MQKKIIALLIIIILFSGCTEKTEKKKEIELKLEGHSSGFEKNSVSLEIFSSDNSEKTRIELFDETGELKCFDYTDLKKGKNTVQVHCTSLNRNLKIKMAPSESPLFESSIQLNTKKIELNKGLKYSFNSKSLFFGTESTTSIFISDKNSEFVKGIALSENEDRNEFVFFIIDRNSNDLHSSGIKQNCLEAAESKLKKEVDEKEEVVILPFFLFYAQQSEDFILNEFIRGKNYFSEDKNLNIVVEINLGEKIIFNGYEAYYAKTSVNGRNAAEFYVHSEFPYILLYYKTEFLEFRLNEIQKEGINCSG